MPYLEACDVGIIDAKQEIKMSSKCCPVFESCVWKLLEAGVGDNPVGSRDMTSSSPPLPPPPPRILIIGEITAESHDRHPECHLL